MPCFVEIGLVVLEKEMKKLKNLRRQWRTSDKSSLVPSVQASSNFNENVILTKFWNCSLISIQVSFLNFVFWIDIFYLQTDPHHIPSNVHLEYGSSSVTVTIKHLTEVNIGQYQCFVINSFGQESKLFRWINQSRCDIKSKILIFFQTCNMILLPLFNTLKNIFVYLISSKYLERY